MRSFGVVVPDVLFEFFFELFFALEGCSFDEVVVERSPESLHFSVGLGTIGSGVAVFDSHFFEHSFKGMLSFLLGIPCAKFRAVIGQDFLELDVVVHVQDIHHP